MHFNRASSLRRQRQLLLRIFHQPLTHTRLLIRIQPHALFCATPQGIVGAADPFVIHQVFQLRFVELMTEIFPEIAYRSRIAEQQLAVAAVSARVVTCQRFSQERVTAAQAGGGGF